MISRAILEKYALLSFSETSNSTHPSDSCYLIELKLTDTCFFHIPLEIILLHRLIFSIFIFSKVTGKFSIRLVPDQKPEAIGKLVIDHLRNVHKQRGSPNKLE